MAEGKTAAVWLADRARGGGHAVGLREVRGVVWDRALMSDVLSLCDAAQEHFARQDDPAGVAYMDAFSIELLRMIGDYLDVRLAR